MQQLLPQSRELVRGLHRGESQLRVRGTGPADRDGLHVDAIRTVEPVEPERLDLVIGLISFLRVGPFNGSLSRAWASVGLAHGGVVPVRGQAGGHVRVGVLAHGG